MPFHDGCTIYSTGHCGSFRRHRARHRPGCRALPQPDRVDAGTAARAAPLVSVGAERQALPPAQWAGPQPVPPPGGVGRRLCVRGAAPLTRPQHLHQCARTRNVSHRRLLLRLLACVRGWADGEVGAVRGPRAFEVARAERFVHASDGDRVLRRRRRAVGGSPRSLLQQVGAGRRLPVRLEIGGSCDILRAVVRSDAGGRRVPRRFRRAVGAGRPDCHVG
mmetsp:Transcript_49888/g.160223  ORF Transcript_49888/g.160223 Transcript_49888/m.160223 type:complete len:220 (-) Transcript_49888:349-1008(-)